jgi:hypothetical protein
MSMRELTQNIEKEKHRINRILSFGTGEYIDMPITSRADPNSKTITTSRVQGETRSTTTRPRPVRKLTPEQELDGVLSLRTS